MFEVHSTLLFSSMIDRLYQRRHVFSQPHKLDAFSSFTWLKENKKKQPWTKISQYLDTMAMHIRRNGEYQVASRLPEPYIHTVCYFRHLFCARRASWTSPFTSIKMAAAVVAGVILALFAVMFNFSVHKIDEGKTKYWEALFVAAVMFKIVFVSFCGKVRLLGLLPLHKAFKIELKAVIEAYLLKTQTSFYVFSYKRCIAKLINI